MHNNSTPTKLKDGPKPLKTEFIINEEDNTATMLLTDRAGITYSILFDLILLDLVKSHRWTPAHTSTNSSNRKERIPYIYDNVERVYFHHLVIGKPPEGLEVDHINRDSTDNRLANLKFVTRRENLLNRGTYKKKADTGGFDQMKKAA